MNREKVHTVFQNFHCDVTIQPIELDLPIIFQKRYEFAKLEITKKTYLLMAEKRTGVIENVVKQAQVVEKQTEKEVILVFRSLSESDKKRLLYLGIPYIDYQENAYLPQIGLLNSRRRKNKPLQKRFTPTEQRVFIQLLLMVPGMMIDIQEMSQLSGLSIPSLYRIFRLFKGRGWLTNKQKSYQFAKPKAMIFDEAKPYLQNPITELVTITESDLLHIKAEVECLPTHLEALSSISMLAHPDSYGQYALSKKQMKKIKMTLAQPVFYGHRIEAWNYEPIPFDYASTIFMNQEKSPINMVDPISLYLTLNDTEDPRIEEEVEQLEKKIKTFLGG